DTRCRRRAPDGEPSGCSSRAGAGPAVLGPARPVLDQDRLAPGLLQFVGERAREHVTAASGGQWNKDLDGACRIILTRGARAHREQGDNRGNDRQHGSPRPDIAYGQFKAFSIELAWRLAAGCVILGRAGSTSPKTH